MRTQKVDSGSIPCNMGVMYHVRIPIGTPRTSAKIFCAFPVSLRACLVLVWLYNSAPTLGEHIRLSDTPEHKYRRCTPVHKCRSLQYFLPGVWNTYNIHSEEDMRWLWGSVRGAEQQLINTRCNRGTKTTFYKKCYHIHSARYPNCFTSQL